MRKTSLYLVFLIIFFISLPMLNAATAETSAPASDQAKSGAEVRIFNRTVAVLRGSFIGVSAVERAERAQEILERLLSKGGNGKVTLEEMPQGYAIKIDDAMAFIMVSEDADWLRQETLTEAAEHTMAAIQKVVHETREANNMSALLRAAGLATAATALLLLALWMLYHVRSLSSRRLAEAAHRYAEKLTFKGESLLHHDRIVSLTNAVVSACNWLIIAFLLYNWVSFVLSCFPYTRPWGEQLSGHLVLAAKSGSATLLHALPGLVIAVLIFFFARLCTGLLNGIFDRIEQHNISIAGLDQDTVRPTRQLVSAGVWLFALVMAYPYLPGSHTQAFKGLSVLVGLMISLGASSVVGQAASGLILMYTRTLRPGEFVQISDSQGTVVEVGMFATRIRTGLGEELTIPNALIIGNITRNYSRTVQGQGYILDATVTIGYDAPWRQVHAMLIEAAQRTNGVLYDPAPQVFQTALSDFYPQYRLVCQAVPTGATPRAEVMSALHENIQDVFNEYGVQIMSPHYLGDPDQPKIVPQDSWAPPPAEK
ncbi:MAG: mechanosensitive ion channel [Geobacteraceae bacterium]|nr:mechanosensitive ion channel [Geobacteraceae bacterium]